MKIDKETKDLVCRIFQARYGQLDDLGLSRREQRSLLWEGIVPQAGGNMVDELLIIASEFKAVLVRVMKPRRLA